MPTRFLNRFPRRAGIAAALCCGLLVASCTTDPHEDADLKVQVNILVLDAYTGAPVPNARVELSGYVAGKTSAGGLVSFKDMRAGAYLIRLSLSGYEESQEPLTVTTAGTEDVAALTVSQTYRIRRQGARITGRLLLRPALAPDTTAIVPAQGVVVELRSTATGTGSANTSYRVPVRTTTTSATGHFTFDSLPEISAYALSVPEFTVNGRTYSQGSTNVASGTLLAGQEYTHPNLLLAPATSGTFQVFARSLLLSPSTTFVLEFNAPVDTAKLASGDIQLRSTVGISTTNIASTRTWSNNFTVLSLVPAAGTWNTGVTYSVMLTSVRDVNGRVLESTTITAVQVP